MPFVTSIQKYSIHDGDGIRTTIFFKGCPLSCVWCHNPETQNYGREIMYDNERCTGCQSCVKACQKSAIREKDGKVSTDKEICDSCGRCIDYCMQNLREVAGKEYSIDELLEEVKKDEMFYEESGGGVTLSGGEVMTMNMDYVEALVKKLHRAGFSVTVDTCGYAPYENFARILPYVDTFLYDIKAMDAQMHKQYIGVDNGLILENLEKLNNAGARIYIRIPTIKEVNGSKESMQQIVDYLTSRHIHAAQVNLLPYHNTGAGKYDKLQEAYEGAGLHAPEKEEMEQFVKIFQNAGFRNTKIGG